jgi:hypothetical protein
MTAQQPALLPEGWAVSGGDDGRATFTYDGLAVATASYHTLAQQATVHALLGRLRTAREPHTCEKREDSSR